MWTLFRPQYQTKPDCKTFFRQSEKYENEMDRQTDDIKELLIILSG